MSSNGALRENLSWAGTFAAGAWLSMKVAHWLVDTITTRGRLDGSSRSVQEVVERVMDEHRAEDTPMVHAFETALASNGTGE